VYLSIARNTSATDFARSDSRAKRAISFESSIAITFVLLATLTSFGVSFYSNIATGILLRNNIFTFFFICARRLF